MVGTALFATTSATLFQFVCSILIGFPLPFSLVLAAIPWTPSILAPIFLLSRRLFQKDRQLFKDLLNYIIVFLCQISITLIYPAYMYVFTSLDGNSQTAFFILLPLIKILTKNWISRFLPGLNDMKPEVVIFNIEIFHSLYVSSALQTATSNLTTVLILLVDLGLLWISVADVNTLLAEVKMIVSRKLSEATASNSLKKSADVPYLDLCILLLDDTGVKVDPRVSTAAVSVPMDLYRSPSTRKILVGPEASDIVTAIQSEPQPSSDQKPQAATGLRSLPPISGGDMAQFLKDRMTHDEKVSFVLKMSQVLFVCEFVVLIEFTEVTVPVMYSIYIAAMSHLVNRVYYPQLANMSEEHLYSTIGNVLAYSSIELVSFLLITLLFKRKLNMSTFHQLAFVLDRQWSMVQSKLILWTFYVIQSSLFHFEMCPHGFDPTSTYTDEKKIRLTIAPAMREPPATKSASVNGKIIITFHAHSVEFDLPLGDVTSEACTKIFKRFQNLAEVTCERMDYDAPGIATYEITLHSFPVYPIMNNLYHHNGNPLSTEFWCDATSARYHISSAAPASAMTCSFESITDVNVKEYMPCSNHGTCSDRTGLCTCHRGFYGDNCANNKDEEDILVAPSTGPFFQGNVLRVSAKREKSTEFNLIKADIAGTTVFTMNGEGHSVFHQGSVELKEGHLIVQDGDVRLQNGGTLSLDSADLKIQNGRIHVQTTMETSQSVTLPLLQLEMLASSANAADFLRLSKQNAPLFRVSSRGTVVVLEGGIEVLKGGVKVQRGGLQVLSDGINVLQGGIELPQDGIRVHNGDLGLLNGVLSLSTVSASKPAVSIERQSLVDSSGRVTKATPLLHIKTNIASAPLISAMSHESLPLFEVLGDGGVRIHGGGLSIDTGGLLVETGGQIIKSGGLQIETGGLLVESGGITTHDGFTIKDGGLEVQNSAINGPVLRLASANPHYAGDMIELTVNQSTSDPPFKLLNARTDTNGQDVFSIDSQGHLVTHGDITTLDNGRIIVNGALISEAQTIFSHIKLPAAREIRVPSSHSYIKITNDGADEANIVRMERDGASAGQLLVLQNEDEQSLEGDVSVKPFSAAIYVFDGHLWRALTAASFDTSVISGVKSFEAANDLNFGNIKLTVQNLQVASQSAGLLALYGKGGELTQDERLAFDASTSTLSVDTLDARSIRGHIDMTDSELHGVEIVGGHISNVNMTELDMVEVVGELYVNEQAYFGASIMVDGQVMGSGAYVDASDARFKTNVTEIVGNTAIETIQALQGVEYSYRFDEFPDKRFNTRREIGFLAQDIERVLPQVIEEDNDGFKYVAYARVVPVVVEALKAERNKRLKLENDVEKLQETVDLLKQQLEQQQELLNKLLVSREVA
ncbi:hypothetical protein Poli38472_010005 [Pythium oligandrum]|uniref:Peptidase S74 domain-containing protein n=1 Tax=Pythium oligandrum TaxID=41045 RepID=A0A8K1C859_PYTOL|nr:hypothetical protein Poli38472_010005 [Pythium oligandrum]|eukprot:TMW58446.1 hypothetical protein Poli38472_010005 [Pythium oligandrum]